MPKQVTIRRGQRFGKLKVLGESDQRYPCNGSRQYDCICDCGNRRTYTATILRNGYAISCGYGRCRRKRGAMPKRFSVGQA